MSARLYPGFGSGKGSFEAFVKVNSFGSVGRDDLEAGDKILLPTSCFKDINRLKLPFPLTFQLHNDKARTAATIPDKKGQLPPGLPEQFAGVLEFSAPEGQAYVPSWMLGNLKLREGGQARLTTIREVPPGKYVKFRPHSKEFVELAGAIGPRELLETALRNYSVLSNGERIIIEVADVKYALDVLEVKPGGKVSLFGHVDLEVDFAPIDDDEPPAAVKPKATSSVAPSNARLATVTKATSVVAAKETPVKPVSVKSAVGTARTATATDTPRGGAPSPPTASKVVRPAVGGAGSIPSPSTAPALSTPVKPKPAEAEKLATYLSPSGHSRGEGVMWFPEMDAIVRGTHGYVAKGVSAGDTSEHKPAIEASMLPDKTQLAQMRLAALRRLQSQEAPATPIPSPQKHVKAGWLTAAAEERVKLREEKLIAANTTVRSPVSMQQSNYDGKEDGKESESKLVEDFYAVDETRRCPHCSSNIALSNFPLHVVHCRRNTAFQKVQCTTCHAEVYQKDLPDHIHCPDCTKLITVIDTLGDKRAASLAQHVSICSQRIVSCECGEKMPSATLLAHKESCPRVLIACKYCKVSHRRSAMEAHKARCGARTMECEHCRKLILMRNMEAHELDHVNGAFDVSESKASEPESKLAEDEGKEDDPSGVRAFVKETEGFAEALAKPAVPGPSKANSVAAKTVVSAAAASSSSLGTALNLRSSSTRAAAAAPGTTREIAKPSGVATARGSSVGPTAKAREARPTVSARDIYPCPHCGTKCRDYEALQMHVFTACTKADVGGGGKEETSPPVARPNISRGTSASAVKRLGSGTSAITPKAGIPSSPRFPAAGTASIATKASAASTVVPASRPSLGVGGRAAVTNSRLGKK